MYKRQVPHHAVNEIPVGGLLGEQAGMLEAHGLELERQLTVADGPLDVYKRQA